ncbi:MAG: class I SAM-dependent methyltransferase [Betaproteobacteria bacterium]|nr:class I SAM-dependent methyltransferase [Betaproteobacteria bacterium]
MKQMKWMAGAGLALTLALPSLLSAQEGVGDVVYVPTPQIVVEEMLRMAKVGPKDFVIDLGSGDGRMVITAAKQFGARGFGVDLDTVLLKLSNENARREGVADRVRFIEQNLFETDLSQATVITSYLLPEMNEKLRPKILNLKPGTRVVAHDYDMGEWYADEMHTLDVPEKKVGNPGKSYVYRWIVPAKIAGRWQSQVATGTQPANWEFEFTQRFQMFDGVAKSGSQKITLRVPNLEGDQVSFQFLTKPGDNSTRHVFKGTVKGDLIEGTLRLGEGGAQKQLPWRAKLTQRAASPK